MFAEYAASRVATATVLIDNGAEVNHRDGLGRTPLWLACWNCSPDMPDLISLVVLLLKRGADVCTVDKSRSTVLHAACCGGSRGLVEVLLGSGAGAMLRERDIRHMTAVEVALERRHDDVAQLLIDWGTSNGVKL